MPSKLRLEHLELPADALDVRGDGVVVEHDVRRVHELLAVLHVAGMLRERVHDPELRQRQQHHLAVPLHLHAFGIERERAAADDLIVLMRLAQGVDAPEQRVHARSGAAGSDPSSGSRRRRGADPTPRRARCRAR